MEKIKRSFAHDFQRLHEYRSDKQKLTDVTKWQSTSNRSVTIEHDTIEHNMIEHETIEHETIAV